jgi:hypothetical protein
MRTKTRYRKFKDGGAVDGAVDVSAPQAGSARVIPSQADPAPSDDSFDPLDNLSVPERAKDYLRKHPEYIYDPDKNAQIQAAHRDLVDEGLEEYSDEYFQEMDIRLGHFGDAMIAAARAAAERAKPNVRPALDDDEYQFKKGDNSSIVFRDANYRERYVARFGEEPPLVSELPERTIPGSNYSDHPSRIKLTPEMKHAAAISGISEAEYARQLIRLREEKVRGNYNQ